MRAVAILMLFWAGAALADQNGAFQDGKSLGSSVNQSAFSGINSGAASDKIPGYGTNPSETQFFQGGQGQLSGPGVAKMQYCATATPDSDPIKQQECEAVNFLARNPQVRPQFTITPNDPMMLAAEYARDNAEDIMAQFGMNQQGSQSQCTTRTDTMPAVYETATCSVAREFVANQCVYGREVVIDTDANFQCEETINAYESLKCTRSPKISVTPGCKDNSDLFIVQYDPCPDCQDYNVTLLRCDASSNRYVARFGSRLKSGSGCYSWYRDGVWDPNYNTCWIDGGPQYVGITPGASLSNVTLVERMDGVYCYRLIGNFNCNTATCTVDMYFSNPCQGTSSYLSTPSFGLPYKLSGISWQNGCAALEARTR